MEQANRHPGTPERGSETILVTEDEEPVSAVLRHALEEFGYQVIVANDGQQAIDTLTARGGEIDLVILDVVLPNKGGKEVYDAINAVRPGLPVLFISGYTADVLYKKGIYREGIQIMTKPLSPYALLGKVREMLDGSK